MGDARNQVLLCQEVESELRDLCLECRKKFPIIKEYTERAILKLRHHRDLAEQDGRAQQDLPEFPLDEVLRAILMACETFQNTIVLLSLTCLQKLIHRRVLKDETIAIVINLMKEQATNGDESVQLKVLQTIMATPSRMTLFNELVVEQLMQLLYVLHNSASATVHHTACAGLSQLAEKMADRAADEIGAEAEIPELQAIAPVIRRHPAASMPTVQPTQAPETLTGPLRMFYVFVQDLCVMADYDVSSLSSRYASDAVERMRTGSREGYWLNSIKFPRPLCLELLCTCVAAHPAIFTGSTECFTLLRHNLCAALLKNLRGCFDFAILIRSIQLLQQLLKSSELAALLMPELQVFLHLMVDLTNAERSPWQRATSLEFLKSVCEDPTALVVLYEHGGTKEVAASPASSPASGSRTFMELVNSLSKLIHQVCFSSGLDSSALLHSAAAAAGTSGGSATAAPSAGSSGSTGGGSSTAPRPPANFGDVGRGLLLLGTVNLPQLLGGGNLSSFGLGSAAGGPGSGAGGARDIFAAGGGASGDGTGAGGSSWASGNGGGGSGGSNSGSGTQTRSSTPAPRMKLLLLMNEAEPPIVQPTLLVSLVIESVFAIVSTLYRLLLETGDEPVLASPGQEASEGSGGGIGDSASNCGSGTGGARSQDVGRRYAPLKGALTSAQERCKGMIGDCWASLLSALSLLLHGAIDEGCLQQALRCLQTLLYCCSRLALEQARNACLEQLSKYALPRLGHEVEIDGSGQGSAVIGGLTMKNILCFKAMLNFCYCYSGLLGSTGWQIALRAFNALERTLQKVQPNQGADSTNLRRALDSLFEATAVLSEEALLDIIDAMSSNMKGISDSDEGIVILSRLVELCSYNLGRLLVVWDRVLRVVTDICMNEERSELQGAAATSLCKVLAQALKKPALAMAQHPEAAQEELLRHLEVLLRVPHEDARARICEGLLGILQASGQELHPAAWGTMIHLVAMAARVELERAGLEFVLPKALDPILSNPGTQEACMDVVAEGSLPPMHAVSSTALDVREASQVLPTVFQLLELLVQDFMEYAPPDSVSHITASIGAFARFTGLGVNSSLTAVGFLWNVADALARYHCAPGSTSAGDPSTMAQPSTSAAQFEELWVQIFMHLRALAVDARPEVRNCAVKSLTSALLSHGKKVGAACYQRCLRDILIEVVAEINAAAKAARAGRVASGGGSGSQGLIVHHSRDTPEKQWNETMVLGVEGVRRVLSHFSEEAGVKAFAPMAYTVLLQVQTTLQSLTAELSSSALRALVDLMRIPASGQAFNASVLTGDPALPITTADDSDTTSIWLLGWSILWRMARFCMTRDVPESLMETFEKTLTSLRNTHRHLFTPGQHLVVLQISLVLTTSPSFYLSSSTPLTPPSGSTGSKPVSDHPLNMVDHSASLAEAVRLCMEEAGAVLSPMDKEVFEFGASAPEILWSFEERVNNGQQSLRTYIKAPSDVGILVDGNQSKNLDIRSMESALREVCQEASSTEEAAQAFLGPGRSPTHRTMLHISSSRLQHVQGFVFGLLEDTQGFPEPQLEVFFLFQCCATFLDIRRVLVDTNKLALAARTLCLLVLFCRRVLLLHLSRLARPGADPGDLAAEAAHLEALLGQAVPHLCRTVASLACAHELPALRLSGFWKLAVEALIYLIEDTLPAVERCTLAPDTLSAYWEATSTSLSDVVMMALTSPHTAPSFQPSPAECADVDLLAQATGNLIAHRLLPCAVAPPEVGECGVRLLVALAGLQSQLSAISAGVAGGMKRTPSTLDSGAGSVATNEPIPEWTNLGHLFDLCARPWEDDGDAAVQRPDEEDCKLSIAALSACTVIAPRSLRVLADRAALLGKAVPALLAHIRDLLAVYAADDCGGPDHCRADSNGHRVDEVLFVLSRLRSLRGDEATASAAASSSAPTARAACELAGSQGLVIALLPALAALITSSDGRVRSDVRSIFEDLSRKLGLV
mmetsp:Transcript_142653/g.371751  ORF Transcript_142653/g.371751 Transcript_142653/m.371751 type:complete len:1968 (+) Transcript_142653:130-6033(+)